MKSKIYKTIKVDDSNSYFNYLNKLVDQYNRTYHRSIGKKPDGDYPGLTLTTKSVHKVLKSKVDDRIKITIQNTFFSKGDTKNWSRQIFVTDSVLNTKHGKIKSTEKK